MENKLRAFKSSKLGTPVPKYQRNKSTTICIRRVHNAFSEFPSDGLRTTNAMQGICARDHYATTSVERSPASITFLFLTSQNTFGRKIHKTTPSKASELTKSESAGNEKFTSLKFE